MIAPHILQKTTTFLHMIHLVTLMDCCNFSEFPTIRVLFHEMQANNTHIQINPKHTLWEGFLAVFETSKLFIIPLINHQNQPLDWISASPSTLRNEFSCTSVGHRNLIPLFQKPLLFSRKTKTTLLICFVAHPFVTPPWDFCRLHFIWQFPCHIVILCPLATHAFQIEENDTKISTP